ncbi:hypothetical protein CU097_006856 [Rhizopus azygosporus]|uniref:Uncharacterized protein n=1 Tax=Rhizopus azygosporus TaxID=86630 RepID=A0A367J8F2_RHIAZ|nr:hypothetical protein CU097_006856 [Rhizopus azygosporus]
MQIGQITKPMYIKLTSTCTLMFMVKSRQVRQSRLHSWQMVSTVLRPFVKMLLPNKSLAIQLIFKSLLYTFTELASFGISLKKCQPLNLIDHLYNMLVVPKLHNTICSTTREDQDHLRCPTYSDWYTREFM